MILLAQPAKLTTGINMVKCAMHNVAQSLVQYKAKNINEVVFVIF